MVRSIALLLCLAIVTFSHPSLAADPHKDAADRFDRGLRLFNDGDNAGAMLEFKRAYELSGERSILVNVGLVYAEMGRPVDAVAALDQVLQQPSGISEAQLGQARRVRDELAARIGRLLVTTNVPAQIEIDNLAVGRSPMGAPISVSSGIRLLGVVAPGHVPIRQEVSVTGGQQTDVAIELLPLQGALANLVVRCILPGADVLVDGKLVGRTPLPASIPLAPGSHEVGLRRPGYRAAPQTITLADGSTGEITLEPVEIAKEADLVNGHVSLDINQPDATVVVDGIPHTGFRNGLSLPAGPHRLSVSRTGFMPLERELTVEKDQPKTLRIQLQPTEETRAAHVHRVSAQRRNAWITIGAGTVVAGVGAYLIVLSQHNQSDADAKFKEWAPKVAKGGACDKSTNQVSAADYQACTDGVNAANSLQDKATRLKWIGWSTAGVGAAALVTGVILRLVADDMDDIKVAAAPRLQPYAWTLPTGGGLGLGGSF
jgi:hypothetical protein